MSADHHWPQQRDCIAFYGDPRGRNGAASPKWEAANLTRLQPPFRMTYAGTPIKSLRIHRLCAQSLARVLLAIWEAAGRDQKKVDAWGASIYGGAYNFRLMRGGSSLSMHSYGCAIDLDPARNAFHDLSGHFHECPQVVAAFEAEGWTWGGRWAGRSCDPMHFQAARL
jgi:hypothetical protein